MKTKIFLLLFILLLGTKAYNQILYGLPSYGQSFGAALKIGDKIPDIAIKQFINDTKSEVQLSALRNGKLLIIDFWATWCGSCIYAFPKLIQLQKQFSDKLLILPVSDEKKEIVDKFLKKNKNIAGGGLFFVTNDNQFKILFPYKYLPHEVWIDQNGYVIAITDGSDVNSINVNKLISRQQISLDTKIDNSAFNIKNPLVTNDQRTSFLFRSVLTKYNSGVNSQTFVERESGGKISRFITTNDFALALFTEAFSDFKFFVVNKKRMEWHLRDSTQYFNPGGEASRDWSKTRSFCYELVLPKAVPDSVFSKYMIEDLNRFFDISAHIEIRTDSCWVLRQINPQVDLIATKGVEKSPIYTGRIRNASLAALVNYLNSYKEMEPIIDETGYKRNVDMDLDFIKEYPLKIYPNMSVVKESFNKYGLDLVKTTRKVNKLIIADK